MSEPFYLKCMGVPELRAPSGRPVKIRGHRHVALLVYLVVERRAQYRRDELATLLWPDVTIAEARHSLSTATYAIRRALGAGVISGDRELVRFDHKIIRTDLDQLLADDLIDPDAQPVVEVDGFLRDFEIRDAPDFARWRDAQHLRLLPQVLAALLRLIDHARRIGSSRLSGELADRLRALDPLSEAGTRAKMEALAFSGDRISALRVFEEWSERLRTELGATPGALVEEMARRLRHRGLERPVNDPSPAVQTDPWRDRPFVGRAKEHRQLYEGWELAQQGAPRHFLVEGESGIGKSTLVERVAMAASLEGAVVARTQCYELERELPFATVSGLVKGLLDKPGVASTDPAALAEVARVVPRLRERFPGLPAPMDYHGELARLHFAEGIMAMLEAAMEEHPVVLVVDDFHLADEVSLMVLHLVLRRQERGPLMVLLTMRTSELAPSSSAARIHRGGEGLRMQNMMLPPLSEAECGELLTSLVQSGAVPPTPAERHTLLQAARGVPMVLQLLVQDWTRHGGQSLAFEFRSMTSRPGGREQPDAEGMYRHLVERVLADLDPVARLVMFAASVLGSRINDLSLYQVADLTTSQTMMGMAALAQRRILRDSPVGLDFVNELVRGQVYTTMPRPLRLELHRAIARRLLARLASGEEMVRGLDIAWHLVRGELAAEAAPHLLRGAREAIREGAPHETELALKSALEGDHVLWDDDRDEAQLLHAEILQELSEWHRSLQAIGSLRPEAIVSRHERATILRQVALQRLRQSDTREYLDQIAALIELVDQSADQANRVRAAAVAASSIQEVQDEVLLDRLWASLRRLTPQFDTPESEADFLRARATIHYCRRDIELAARDIVAAVTVAENANIASTRYVELLSNLAALKCSTGDYELAREIGENAYRLATRLDNLYLTFKGAGNVALAMLRTGRYEAQLDWVEKYFKALGRGGHGIDYMRGALYLGMGKAMRGDRDTFACYWERMSIAPAIDSAWGNQAEALNRADIHQLLGQRKLALTAARSEAAGLTQPLLGRGWAGPYARWSCALAVDTGNRRDALRNLAPLWEDFGRQDAIDKVELACAYFTLQNRRTKRDWENFEHAKEVYLRQHPAVHEQLDRLGSVSGAVKPLLSP